MNRYQLPVVAIADMPKVALQEMNEVHLEEVGLINRLGELVMQGIAGDADLDEIERVLDEWLLHTRDHFENENRLMETYAFPPYPVHKAEHNQVLSRIESLMAEWSQEQELVQLADFIFVEWRGWFDQHVNSMDKVTAQFLNQVM
ncbi:MAG: hemerythrin family protein [Candidatus Thiodiazotropha sp.]